MIVSDEYVVFGHPIAHSQSPIIHGLFAKETRQDIRYTAKDVPAEIFEQSINSFFNSGGKGVNCTVPLKELAWERADERTQRAEISGAVNTLVLLNDGRILGDNTDGVGLVRDLTENLNISLMGKNILLLGAGGASRGILLPLLEQKPSKIVIANRTIEKAIALASQFTDFGPVSGCGYDALGETRFDLILNATAASLQNDLPPLPDGCLKSVGYCYDLAYGSQPTPFVRWGNEHHAKISTDGIGMLVEQAAEAFLLWRGIMPSTVPVIDQLNKQRGKG
ncbi:MAG: shikimate dehydrogenase [Methylococcales bacterium]